MKSITQKTNRKKEMESKSQKKEKKDEKENYAPAQKIKRGRKGDLDPKKIKADNSDKGRVVEQTNQPKEVFFEEDSAKDQY